MLGGIVLIYLLSLCQAMTFSDRETYPDLFGPNGQRRNEIDSRSIYVNYNRPIIGGFTTQWKADFVTMIFVGTPCKCLLN